MSHDLKLLALALGCAVLIGIAAGPEAMLQARKSQAEMTAEQEAIAAAKREKRKEKAAREICGNGSLLWHDDVSMSCINRITGKEGVKNAL